MRSPVIPRLTERNNLTPAQPRPGPRPAAGHPGLDRYRGRRKGQTRSRGLDRETEARPFGWTFHIAAIVGCFATAFRTQQLGSKMAESYEFEVRCWIGDNDKYPFDKGRIHMVLPADKPENQRHLFFDDPESKHYQHLHDYILYLREQQLRERQNVA